MKKAKRFLAAALSIVMIALIFPQAHVEAAPANSVTVILDGKLVDFEDTYAQIIHEYTYVPIAKIIEILTNLVPTWNDAEKSAEFVFNGKKFKIFTAQKGIYVDGKFQEFETYPEIVNSRTLIPLRMLSNALEFGLEWDDASRTVKLTSPTAPAHSATVVSVTPDSFSYSAGSSVTVNVLASLNSIQAKVVDANNRTMAETKSYTASGSNNIFSLTFTPNASGVYRVYAASELGYNLDSYKNVSLTQSQTSTGAKIYEAYSSSTEVDVNSSSTIYVTTDSSVTNVYLSIASGGGSLRSNSITSYTETSGRRRFETTYYAGSTAGTTRINVTATPSSGSTDSTSVTISVRGSSYTDGRVYDVSVRPAQIAAGTLVSATITTGLDVAQVNCYNTFQSASYNAYGGTVNGNRKTWTYEFTTPSTSWDQNCVVYATAYNTNGSQTDSGSTQFTVLPNIVTDGRIYTVSISPATTVQYGTRVFVTIGTGLDVYSVNCYNDLTGSFDQAYGGSTTGSRRNWTYEFTVPDYGIHRDDFTLTFTAVDNTGNDTDATSRDMYIEHPLIYTGITGPVGY